MGNLEMGRHPFLHRGDCFGHILLVTLGALFFNLFVAPSPTHSIKDTQIVEDDEESNETECDEYCWCER